MVKYKKQYNTDNTSTQPDKPWCFIAFVASLLLPPAMPCQNSANNTPDSEQVNADLCMGKSKIFSKKSDKRKLKYKA